jgi:hypothetical protein
LRLRDLLDAYRSLRQSWIMLTLYAAHFTRAIAWIGILTYISAFIRDTYGFDERDFG